MLSISFALKNLVSWVFLLLLLTVLSACSSESTDLPPTVVDSVKPFVVSTEPASKSTSKLVPIISIRFSEPIASFTPNNISITPLIENGLLGIPQNPAPEILFINATNDNRVVEVKLNSTDSNIELLSDTVYLVELSGVEDLSGNIMAGMCMWLFATGSAIVDPAIAGNDVCDTPHPNVQPGTLSFDLATSNLSESAASAILTISRSGGSDRSVSVDYNSADGSATAGSDYTALSGTVSFADGVTSKSINIAILDDNILEGNETFTLTLSNATGGAILGANIVHSITIVDDEIAQPGIVSFKLSSSSISENVLGGLVNVTVIRSAGSNGSISVNYSSVDGTAIAGSDYTAGSGTLTFADGVLQQSFSIMILDDTVLEGDESFTLRLSSVTGAAVLGSIISHSVSIIDDETPQPGIIEFNQFESSVTENTASGNVTLDITRSAGSNGIVSVDYATLDGTALAGSDYTATSGTLTFNDGVTNLSITIAITNDSVYELDEFFNVVLTAATGGASLGEGTQHTVTILDDDAVPGRFEFANPASNISESVATGNVALSVIRRGGSDGAVTINYATQNGSATAGNDFVAVSNGVVTFADGVLEQTIIIQIINDAIISEGNETFSVLLSNPSSGATLGGNRNHTVRIIDNDILTLNFGPKQLQFSWSSYPRASFYQLFENTGNGYVQLATNLNSNSYTIDIDVLYYNWMNSRYLLKACNANSCISSNEVVTLDQAINAIGYFKAHNSTQLDFFGYAVALSADGNTLAVAAIGEDSSTSGINSPVDDLAKESGAVYVFSRGSTVWQQQAYLKAGNSGTGDLFGISLAISNDGNTLLVGAQFEDGSSNTINGASNELAPNAGAAYVFTRVANSWSQQAYLKAGNAGTGDRFGVSVDLSGDGNTAVIGAYYENSSTIGISPPSDELAPNAGAAYLFTRTMTTWSQHSYIKASNTGARDYFGRAVTISADGTTLAIGAYLEDSSTLGPNIDSLSANEASLDSGAVYVFILINNMWSQQAYIKASNTGNEDWFGGVLTLNANGNTLVVSAISEDSATPGINSLNPNDALLGSGAVYVFSRTNGLWLQQAYIKSALPGQNDIFGRSIAINAAGDVIAVGAPFEDSSSTGINGISNNLAVNSGAVYIFKRSINLIWTQQVFVKARNTGDVDEFGIAVTLSADGNTLAVGAYKEDSGSLGINSQANEAVTDAGAVYLY